MLVAVWGTCVRIAATQARRPGVCSILHPAMAKRKWLEGMLAVAPADVWGIPFGEAYNWIVVNQGEPTEDDRACSFLGGGAQCRLLSSVQGTGGCRCVCSSGRQGGINDILGAHTAQRSLARGGGGLEKMLREFFSYPPPFRGYPPKKNSTACMNFFSQGENFYRELLELACNLHFANC